MAVAAVSSFSPVKHAYISPSSSALPWLSCRLAPNIAIEGMVQCQECYDDFSAVDSFPAFSPTPQNFSPRFAQTRGSPSVTLQMPLPIIIASQQLRPCLIINMHKLSLRQEYKWLSSEPCHTDGTAQYSLVVKYPSARLTPLLILNELFHDSYSPTRCRIFNPSNRTKHHLVGPHLQ